jgi:hypothetical protein
MGDISITTGRIIPITVELYTKDTVQYPIDPIVVNKDDSEFTLQFILTNKASTTPYAVEVTDISSMDKIEITFLDPEGGEVIRSAILLAGGSDGIMFYVCLLNDLNVVGCWTVRATLTKDDVVVNYPNVPFRVE